MYIYIIVLVRTILRVVGETRQYSTYYGCITDVRLPEHPTLSSHSFSSFWPCLGTNSFSPHTSLKQCFTFLYIYKQVRKLLFSCSIVIRQEQ